MSSNIPMPLDSFSHARIVPLKGGVNFRDIGGYATDDGRHVRWRRIYRSGQLDRLTDDDVDVLAERRILSIVDLREPPEIANSPSRLPADAKVVHCSAGKNPMFDWAHMLAGATSGVPFMRAFYAETQGLAARFKPFFQTLLDLPADRALLLHCMAGKDRTGMGIALLLVALGVPRTIIVDDYLLTNKFTVPALNADIRTLSKMNLPESVVRDLLAARPEYLQSFFASLETHHGSPEQFLAQALGLTTEKIRQLRDKFTE